MAKNSQDVPQNWPTGRRSQIRGTDRPNGQGEFRLGLQSDVGALPNLGHQISVQTMGNVLKRHGIAPALERSQSTTWKEFIQSHLAVLAGIDFFTVEVLS
jgi:hypothetical protein